MNTITNIQKHKYKRKFKHKPKTTNTQKHEHVDQNTNTAWYKEEGSCLVDSQLVRTYKYTYKNMGTRQQTDIYVNKAFVFRAQEHTNHKQTIIDTHMHTFTYIHKYTHTHTKNKHTHKPVS